MSGREPNVRNRIVLLHTMDPRGAKLGGIETHVRLMLAHHPVSTSVLFVGIDETGDLGLGQAVPLIYEGRHIDFLPVAHVPANVINKAAKRIGQSTTLRYAMGLLRHIGAIRAASRGFPGSCEIERFEFALIPKLLGLPLVLLVHNEGTSKDAMDSLLKRYWALHLLNERLALVLAKRVFAVNPSIAKRIAGFSATLGAKTDVMSVSVDTRRFAPTGFEDHHQAFHVCFAGRLDAFKDPELMFATLARVAARLEERSVGRFRRLVFDYVGASDPQKFQTFGVIAGRTICHGIRTPSEVAAIMRTAHAGLITSFFEGMPCYLLEMLASGRPVVAIALPQFAQVIVPGVSGELVERDASPAVSSERLAQRLLDMALDIEGGRVDPDLIASRVRSFSVDAQLRRLFACHEALAAGGSRRSKPSESISSA